jgi:MoxR-like ATPase
VAVKPADVAPSGNAILDAVGAAIVGKRPVLEKMLLAILCDGHVLIEDYPGLAKTLMAKSFAAALGCTFKRVQFTPDLLPADITGTYIFDRKTSEFVLRKGPVFTNVLLADEINRAPPKTQAALLEAMQERQTTLEGETHPLPRPFLVFATQNPIEYEGTYPLPEAQIDRFLMRIDIGYPDRTQEKEILDRRRQRRSDDVPIAAIADPEQVFAMQAACEDVHVDDDLERYIVEVVTRTREHSQVEVGASPRGSLALMKLGRASAALKGRDYVVPDDVKAVAVEALAHRILLKPDPWIKGVRTASIVREVLAAVAVPKVE